MSQAAQSGAVLEPEVDAGFAVLGFPYHDGSLVGFSAEAGTHRFHVVAISGERVTLELQGVVDFCIRDFWPSPIVNNILYAPIARSALDGGLLSDTWLDLLEGRAQDIPAQARRIRAAHPEASLFHLSCSYGGQFTAVAHRLLVLVE